MPLEPNPTSSLDQGLRQASEGDVTPVEQDHVRSFVGCVGSP